MKLSTAIARFDTQLRADGKSQRTRQQALRSAGAAQAPALAQSSRHHAAAQRALAQAHLCHEALPQDRRPPPCAASPRPQAHRHDRDLRTGPGQGAQEGDRQHVSERLAEV